MKDYIHKIDPEADRRTISEPMEFREEGEEKFFQGYAFVYNTRTDIGGEFIEEIAPGAADEVMNDDVRALFNHDPNFVLGRTKSGTLKIMSDERGLRYQIKFNPNDSDHVNLRERILRGDVDQSSFAFRKKEDRWGKLDGKRHRVLVKLQKLIDVSPVTYAAYNDATVAMRSMNLTEEDYKKDLAEMDLVAMKLQLNSKTK